MCSVTAVRFQSHGNANVPFTSVVDNGLLHTGPRSDQTRVRYTNK